MEKGINQSTGLRVVTFADAVDARMAQLQADVAGHRLDLSILGSGKPWPRNSVKLRYLSEFLNQLDPQAPVLVVDAFDVTINATAATIIDRFNSLQAEVIFSAEANFYMRSSAALFYYYWKHYPRPHALYNYLNSGCFMGKCEHLRALIADISAAYLLDLRNDKVLYRVRSDQYLFSRFYADYMNRCISPKYRIGLDHEQVLFANSGGRMHADYYSGKNWVADFLFFRNERKLLKKTNLSGYQLLASDFHYAPETQTFHNRLTGTKPCVLHLPGTYGQFGKALSLLKGERRVPFVNRSLLKPFMAMVQIKTAHQMRFIHKKNRGDLTRSHIFRYSPNKNQQLAQATGQLVQLLKDRQPFAFAHFNDGEFSFIRDFINKEDHQDWYGRKQHQYDPLVGERLLQAARYQKKNYFVGVPCSRCHTELRQLADEIVGDYEYKVPAMTLHHNLARLPEILSLLKGREIYFFKNENQNLALLKELGIDISPERVFNVPFKNSYLQFEKFRDRSFADGAVVLSTVGMLAKILIKPWFENNPATTFITLGSILDDHIQKNHTAFQLYPARTPFTSNIRKGRTFLFGRKRHCPECFDFL